MQSSKLILLLPLICVLALCASPTVDAQSLRGSRASVDRMYREAKNQELHFYETSWGVNRAVTRGRFVPLEGNRDYEVKSIRYPYVLPEAHTFVTRLAAQYRSACGERLVVTSAVRPTSFRLVNSVAESVHPTGMAIDLRRPTKGRCLSWLRETLLSLEGTGVIEATEERRPPHFHVAVFPRQYARYVERRGGTVRLASDEPKSGGGTSYRVRKGDSLWGIARRHGTSVENIKQANEMRGSRIVAGQLLQIPDAR